MANIHLYPTRCAGRITGYCVEIEGTDACGEFHSGSEVENKRNAELFAQALVLASVQNAQTA